MWALRDHLQNMQVFPDQTVLGNFIDNHDNARWLSYASNLARYRSAIVLNLAMEGIPIIYYGTEQLFNGGNDPNNREPLWTSMDTTAPMYEYLALVNGLRK